MRLFLDANVLFSAAHNPSGNSRALFALADLTQSQLVSSAFAVEEATRNLRLKYPDAESALAIPIPKLELATASDSRAIATASAHDLPPKDIPILAGAIAATTQVLVTGDQRHFGPLLGKRVGTLEILTPAQAVLRLLNRLDRQR